MNQKRSAADFLNEIKQDEKEQTEGNLKIFFGFAAGVGKTYTMLEAAHKAKENGVDVVAGYVEPHARPETAALLTGLEVLPFKKIEYGGIVLNEFDLDLALKRKPKLILVDELAHTNARGCRHSKRYQDIEELLQNGIDVYTTVNVQHIESLNDLVASVTGVTVRERFPDAVFDSADQVELVDIEPEDLLERLKSGKVYKENQAERAINHFFTKEHLTSLREIALRRCADRMNILTEKNRMKNKKEVSSGEHILVCLSSSPSNMKIIRTAARMAAAFKSQFTALFVETSDFSSMSRENLERLRKNVHLAEHLGAKIATVYGDNVPYQIAEFVKLSGISKIVLGRSVANRHNLLFKKTLTDRLIEALPNTDVYIIPDLSARKSKNTQRKKRGKSSVFHVKDVLLTFGILLSVVLLSSLFDYLHFTESNIITLFILGVLFTAAYTSHRIYSLTSAALGVLIFNFLYTEPRYSLEAYDSGYPVTFLVMFIAALFTGSLAAKLKGSALQSAKSAYRTKVLLEVNQLFQKARTEEDLHEAVAKQTVKLFQSDVVLYPVKEGVLLEPKFYYSENGKEKKQYESKNELAIASWVMQNKKSAGKNTDTLKTSQFQYYPMYMENTVYGVLGIALETRSIDAYEIGILKSILSECALAFENEKNRRKKEKEEEHAL